jgi:hypothetical protein
VSDIFRLPNATLHDPAIDAWFLAPGCEVRLLVQPWFERMRACGPDVRELMHDGFPTACVRDAAFAYVGAFSAHASVGFFHGAVLDDPDGLLEGTGKRMRHVKLRWRAKVDEAALDALIAAASLDVRERLERG